MYSNTLYVSAPFDASGGSQTGSVSIYTEVSVDNWELLDKFTPSDSQNGDRFGISLDVDDTATFAVGSNVSFFFRAVSLIQHHFPTQFYSDLTGCIRRCRCSLSVRAFWYVEYLRVILCRKCCTHFPFAREIVGGNVEFIQKLTSASPSASENFGKDVAIESGKLAVGAPNPGGVSVVYWNSLIESYN